MNLLLHPTTSVHLKHLLKSSPNSIIINGPSGSGKKTIAFYISHHFIGNLVNNPNYLEIIPGSSSIGIDDIRSIYSFLSRKSLSTGEIKRVVVIQSASAMTIEAQNALLKTLEEPPSDTCIMLLSDDSEKLKSTIKSRSYTLNILPIPLSDALRYFSNTAVEKVTSFFHMTNGRIGMLATILNNDEDDSLITLVDEAKTVLKMPIYQRLSMIDSLSKDTIRIDSLLYGLEVVALMGLRVSSQKSNIKTADRFYNITRTIYHTRGSLRANPNSKLILTNLFINI